MHTIALPTYNSVGDFLSAEFVMVGLILLFILLMVSYLVATAQNTAETLTKKRILSFWFMHDLMHSGIVAAFLAVWVACVVRSRQQLSWQGVVCMWGDTA